MHIVFSKILRITDQGHTAPDLYYFKVLSKIKKLSMIEKVL
jgi:hypothetical protein